MFSGVGVTIFLLAGGFLYRSCGTRDISTSSAVHGPDSTAPPVAFTKPTPDEIKSQLDALPSFQQKGAAEAYSGLKVFWPATFSSLVEDSSEPHKWLVILYYDKQYDNAIACRGVDVEANPRLKLARKGEVAEVHGTIQSVSSGDIWLKDVSIDFK